jgi:hypothetical protein
MAKTVGSIRGVRSAAKSSENSISSVEGRIYLQNFESAALYQNGEFVFFKDGESARVRFTEEEAAKMQGGILTHNHPSSRSFSEADFTLLANRQLKEIRAVSKYFTYSVVNESGKTISWTDVGDYYKKKNREVFKEFSDKINSGFLTAERAEAQHAHLVSVAVAKKFGLKYTRTINPKASFTDKEFISSFFSLSTSKIKP